MLEILKHGDIVIYLFIINGKKSIYRIKGQTSVNTCYILVYHHKDQSNAINI